MLKGRVETVEIDDIPVVVTYTAVRNMNLRVRRDGTVAASVPLLAPRDVVHGFLEERSAWIAEHQQRVLDRVEAQSVGSELSPVAEYEARTTLQERLERFVPLWETRIGVSCAGWQIRKMKSRWGSCSIASKRIRFAFSLAFVSDDCLEYVVVHELCHLIEPDHGERFKSLMTKSLPDWKERRAALHH
jgi:predicted metal-dependent hydrolase